MLSVDAKGVFPIAPTPFLADGAIDTASVDRMIDHYVAAGADGCTILGIMGEAPKLDQDEAIGFVARCVARAPKLPFIVGVSAPGFAAMRALSHAAMAKGAAGVMIAPPPSLRTDGRCHANQIWPARRLEVPTQVQAVAARHVWKASSRKTRSVRRDVRWHWTLKIPWRVDSG